MPFFCQQGSSTLERATSLYVEDDLPSALLLKRKRAERSRARRIQRSKSALANISGQWGTSAYGQGMFRSETRSLLQTPCSKPSKQGPDPYSLPSTRVFTSSTPMLTAPALRILGGEDGSHGRSAASGGPPDPSVRPQSSAMNCSALLATSWYPDTTMVAEYSGMRYPMGALHKTSANIRSTDSDRKVMSWDSKPAGTIGHAREVLKFDTCFSSNRVDRNGASAQFGRSGTGRATPLSRSGTWTAGKMSTRFDVRSSSAVK